MTQMLTLVTVPGFSGTPRGLEGLKPLRRYRSRTMGLPDEARNIEEYADFAEGSVRNLKSYVLLGDSLRPN